MTDTKTNTTGKIAYSTREFSTLAGIHRQTAYRWRVTGEGPPYVRLGTKILYLHTDVMEWLVSRRVGAQ